MSFAPVQATMPLNSIETVSGRFVDALNPEPDTICVEDIAWSLSRQARYAGHTLGEPYSVAQHTVFVHRLLDIATSIKTTTPIWKSFNAWMHDKVVTEKLGLDKKDYGPPVPILDYNKQCRPEILRRGLHHDDTEAYLVDVPSPVKRHPDFRPVYSAIELKLQDAIFAHYGYTPMASNWYVDKAVIWADALALQIEAAHLMPSRGRGWAGVLPMFDVSMMDLMPKILPWNDAREQYLEVHEKLT